MRKSIMWVAVAGALLALSVGGYRFYQDKQSERPAVSARDILVIKGADALMPVVSALAKAFMAEHPGKTIIVQSGYSSVGIQAMLDKQVSFINSSRPMMPEELVQAQSAGLDVHEWVLALDAVTFIANAANPVSQLAFEDVADIISGKESSWKKFAGNDDSITPLTLPDISSTHAFLHERIIKERIHSKDLQIIPNSSGVVDAVATDVSAISYVSVGYVRDGKNAVHPGIKALSIASTTTGEYVSPLDEEAVRSGKYPLVRELYQYTSALPSADSIAGQFLRFEYSEAGQKIIKDMGYYAANPASLSEDRAKLGM